MTEQELVAKYRAYLRATADGKAACSLLIADALFRLAEAAETELSGCECEDCDCEDNQDCGEEAP